MYLVVEFVRYGERGIVARIVEQDIRLRYSHLDYSNGVVPGYRVTRLSCPELSQNQLYIRGSENSYDDIIICTNYPSSDERDYAMSKWKDTIEAVNVFIAREIKLGRIGG